MAASDTSRTQSRHAMPPLPRLRGRWPSRPRCRHPFLAVKSVGGVPVFPLAPRAEPKQGEGPRSVSSEAGEGSSHSHPHPLAQVALPLLQAGEVNNPSPRERSEWGEGGDGARAPERGEGRHGPTLTRSRKLRSRPLPQAGEV